MNIDSYWLCSPEGYHRYENDNADETANESVNGGYEEKADIVELLEAVAYLICQDDPIKPDTFHRILSSRGVPAKILRLADTNKDGTVSVEEMMNFIIGITNPT